MSGGDDRGDERANGDGRSPDFRLKPWTPSAAWAGRPAPGSRRRARRRRLRDRLLFASAGCVAVAFVVGSTSVDSVSPTLDEGYVRAAVDVCRPVKERLAERSREDRVASFELVVTELDTMVDELALIPPPPEDAGEVAVWLEDWRSFVEVGRRTAAGLRDGDDGAADAGADAGEAPMAGINDVTTRNGMPACSTAVPVT